MPGQVLAFFPGSKVPKVNNFFPARAGQEVTVRGK